MTHAVRILLGSLLILCHGCGGASGNGRGPGEAEATPVDLASEMAAWRELKKAEGTRWRAVLEEIESEPREPWAGTYYAGDGLGFNLYLSVAPRSGFVYEVAGCMGRYDQNLGNVESLSQSRLVLRAEMPAMRNLAAHSAAPSAPEEEYRFVRWGERRYLIGTRDLDEFRSAVARGDEPRRRVHGRFLLAMNDHTRPVVGGPQIEADGNETPAGGRPK